MDLVQSLIAAAGAALGGVALWLRFGRRRRGVRNAAARVARHDRCRRRAQTLVQTVRAMNPRENPERVFGYLRAVDPFVFEEAILVLLEQRGLKVKRNERYTGDGGIDGRFFHDGRTWLIQAKRYKGRIRAGDVWSFDAACQEEDAKGLFVSTGRTPEEAWAVQRESDRVRIISGQDLMLLFSGERISLEKPISRASRVPSPAVPA